MLHPGQWRAIGQDVYSLVVTQLLAIVACKRPFHTRTRSLPGVNDAPSLQDATAIQGLWQDLRSVRPESNGAAESRHASQVRLRRDWSNGPGGRNFLEIPRKGRITYYTNTSLLGLDPGPLRWTAPCATSCSRWRDHLSLSHAGVARES